MSVLSLGKTQPVARFGVKSLRLQSLGPHGLYSKLFKGGLRGGLYSSVL